MKLADKLVMQAKIFNQRDFQDELYRDYGITQISYDPIMEMTLVHLISAEALRKISQGKEAEVIAGELFTESTALEYHEGDTIYFTKK